VQVVHAVAGVVLLLEQVVVLLCDHSARHAFNGRPWVTVRLHMSQTSVAALPLQLQCLYQVDLGREVAVLELNEGVGLAVLLCFLLFCEAVKEGTLSVVLFELHEAVLVFLKANEAGLLFKLRCSQALE